MPYSSKRSFGQTIELLDQLNDPTRGNAFLTSDGTDSTWNGQFEFVMARHASDANVYHDFYSDAGDNNTVITERRNGVLVPLEWDVGRDETTDLTTGTGKYSTVIPFAFVPLRVYAHCTTAPTGAAVIVDVNDDGTSILATNVQVADGANVGFTLSFATAFPNQRIAAGSIITVDIDQIGSSTAGKGLKIIMTGFREI